MVVSSAEALVGEFYESVKSRLARGEFTLRPAQLARVLMRHPELSPAFATCLQYYITTLDQTRGNRNPSYKQMTSAVTQRNQSFRRFTEELLGRMPTLIQLSSELASLHQYHFHPYVVDWHSIAGQLPEVHRHFQLPAFNRNVLLKRTRGDADGKPPWALGR